jgi:D-methionine transport system ATP-binding protein
MNAHFRRLSTAPAGAGDRLQAAVSFVDVAKIYSARGASAAVTALDDASFDVPSGAIAGIIGRSGAGKSTLVRLVNGLERPSRGQVFVAGVDISALTGEALRMQQRRIGMVFQHFNLLSSRTAFGNIALPLEFAGRPSAEIEARVEELLALVGLADKRDAYPAELSGGQKQRVGVARALAMQPDILLCDEATSALDPETTQQILELLRKVNRVTGVTILMITHEMHVVKSIADRLIVLDHGRVVEAGETYGIFAHPQAMITRSFIDTVSGAAPESLREDLRSAPLDGGRAILRIVFAGQNAEKPVLSRLSRDLGLEIEIVAGQIDRVAGHPFGVLIVAVSSAPDVLAKLQSALAALDLRSEVLGYVA